MLGDPLISVRAALATTTNTTGGDGRSGIGGVEIQKMIDRLIVDDVNRNVDLTPLIQRRPMEQLSYIWNIRTNLGVSSKAIFYAEGTTGTPYESTKIQYFAPAKALRSDYAVQGLMIAGSRSYYDALADEARDALAEMTLREEKSFICGDDASAYGLTLSYDGLIQLMGSNALFGDTDTIYGTARTGNRDELDVSLVGAAASGSTDALDLKDLDESERLSDDAGAKGNKRIYFCSTARGKEIDQLLQPQGRFTIGAGSLELEGGTHVSTYRGHPIVTSRFMDKNGVLWTGSKSFSYTDAAMYFLDLDNIEFRILSGVDKQHVPIKGEDTSIRKDEEGGYFKTYGVFIMKRFRTQVLIYNLAVP